MLGKMQHCCFHQRAVCRARSSYSRREQLGLRVQTRYFYDRSLLNMSQPGSPTKPFLPHSHTQHLPYGLNPNICLSCRERLDRACRPHDIPGKRNCTGECAENTCSMNKTPAAALLPLAQHRPGQVTTHTVAGRGRTASWRTPSTRPQQPRRSPPGPQRRWLSKRW